MADKTGYIGRNPGDSNVIIARQTYRPTGVQTSFSFNTGYTPGYLDVYLNGSKLVNSLDYKATSGGTVEITDAPISGDIVEIVAYKAYSLGTALDSVAGDMSVGGDLTATNATISGTVTAGIGSFDAFTFDNLLVSGISTLTGTANIGDSIHSGVATFSAAGDFDSTISVAQTATFSSDVSIAGTLTYEDVKNIDSVGLITARSGVRINTGGLIVSSGVSTFVGLVTAGSGVRLGTGVTISASSTNNFALQTNGADRLIINENGSVGIGTTLPSNENSSSYESIHFAHRGTLFTFDSSDTSNQTGLVHNAYYADDNQFHKKSSLINAGAGILRIINSSSSNKGYLEFGSGITTSGPGVALTSRFEVTMDGTVKIKNNGSVSDFFDTTIDPSLFVIGGVSEGQNNSGGSIGFSRINSLNRMGAVIAAEQTGSDADQMGLSIYTHPSTNTGSNLSKAVIIDHSGNFGIGATNPASKLNVATNTAARASLTYDSANILNLDYGTIQLAFGVDPYSPFGSYLQSRDNTNGSRILSLNPEGGNVGINTDSASHPLEVLGSSSDTIDETTGVFKCRASGGNGMLFGTRASSPFESYIQSAFVQDTSVQRYALLLNPIGGNVGVNMTNPQTPLHVTGAIRSSTLSGTGNRAVYSAPSGTLTNSSSDATLKTNVTTLDSQLETVKQLNPISFNWIDTEELGSQREIGFIAQEVEPLVPEVIGVNEDETLSLDYPKLTAVLTKALQEAVAKIESLEKRIESLES